jgi:hypothetical protein
MRPGAPSRVELLKGTSGPAALLQVKRARRWLYCCQPRSAYDLEQIERPLVSILNLCIQWVGDQSYPNIHRRLSFRTEDLPEVSST